MYRLLIVCLLVLLPGCVSNRIPEASVSLSGAVLLDTIQHKTFTFTANTANTDGATLNVNTLGAKNILKMHDQALVTGDIGALVAAKATGEL